ncbi:hypothetical protein MTR67_036367 [Solanum verrucosum]|uniref:LRR-RLK n=1 Tax=Solanum verrucosum TaxID=315347 RepID=A0AAF0UBL6_SOLVR|nr:hypothetical protein MTR67_036367 [Solanum verrucosum]
MATFRIGTDCFASTENSSVSVLIESMGLSGNLDIHTLSQLTSLSVMNNNFEGSFPNVRKLTGLRSLLFSNNHFSGELPDDIFTGMKFMRRILMANNEFTGSLLGIPKLVELQVQDKSV